MGNDEVIDRGWPLAGAPFHGGEQAVQARAGLRDRMAEVGPRMIRTAMPEQHRELFGKLPFMLLGALDDQARPWAALVAGTPGFVHTPDDRTLHMAARPLGARLLSLALDEGAPVGLLGIELTTRRRNRVNGVVVASAGDGLGIGVRQSFGNCPKYIQVRAPIAVPAGTAPQEAVAFDGLLPASACGLLLQADTFFIATASADAGGLLQAGNSGVDVSHRGGKPGFVRVGEEGGHSLLTIPDFAGNAFFNTLGNIEINPVAGLLAADWDTGDLLMLTGRAGVLWEGPELSRFSGAQRLLRMQVTQGWWCPAWMPFRASGVAYAAQLEATGAWEDAAT